MYLIAAFKSQFDPIKVHSWMVKCHAAIYQTNFNIEKVETHLPHLPSKMCFTCMLCGILHYTAVSPQIYASVYVHV